MQGGYGNCYSCYSGIEDFERSFVRYAKEKLSLLMDHFSLGVNASGEVIISEAALFLKGVEVLSLAVAEIIESSFWSAGLSCSASRLKSINLRLQQYNLGNRTRYSNDRIAALLIYGDLQRIILDINGC